MEPRRYPPPSRPWRLLTGSSCRRLVHSLAAVEAAEAAHRDLAPHKDAKAVQRDLARIKRRQERDAGMRDEVRNPLGAAEW